MANQEKDHGIELYEELPPIRKTLLGQVQALEHPSWNPICSIFFLLQKSEYSSWKNVWIKFFDIQMAVFCFDLDFIITSQDVKELRDFL